MPTHHQHSEDRAAAESEAAGDRRRSASSISTLAGQTLLEEGHTEARFLLAPEGHPIPGEEVDRLKLVVVDGRVVQNAVVPEPESAQAPEPVPVAQPELEVQTPPEPEAERSAARGKREPK
jgi:hypothetical protein